MATPVLTRQPTHGLSTGERLVTALLLTLWTASILLTLWATPQRATAADAEAAIVGNQITSTERISQPPHNWLTQVVKTDFLTEDPPFDQGEYLEWTDRLHRHHWIPLAEVTQVAARHADPTVTHGTSSSDTPATGSELTYYQFNEHHAHSYISWETLPAMVLGLMEFGLVIAGAARRGTRWFWFWVLLVPGLPLDAGLPLYLWSEVLHRGRWGRRRRVSGWYGLGLCFLATVVAQMAVVTLGGIWQLVTGR